MTIILIVLLNKILCLDKMLKDELTLIVSLL